MAIFKTALIVAALTSCTSLSFYAQAVAGQTSLLWNRKDISRVMMDPDTDEATKSRLKLVVEILDFAGKELDLAVDKAYSTYVPTGKPYIVWNVFAAPRWSLEMESFCYPIAGCVSYQEYSQSRQRESEVLTLIEVSRDELESLYASGSSLENMNAGKVAVLGQLDKPTRDESLAALLGTATKST